MPETMRSVEAQLMAMPRADLQILLWRAWIGMSRGCLWSHGMNLPGSLIEWDQIAVEMGDGLGPDYFSDGVLMEPEHGLRVCGVWSL
jgi:hypothetical protein